MQVEIRNMSKRFGGLQALDSVSIATQIGQVAAVIGPNGSGKSTLVNCCTGVFRPDQGTVTIGDFCGENVRSADLVEFGISRTFQNIRLWDHLTCLQHIELARYNYLSSTRGRREKNPEPVAEAGRRLLDRVELLPKGRLLPSELSYGEKRRLEIVRALSMNPKLLFLDEPAAGFTLSEQAKLGKLILEIAESGIAVVLIEHHMDLVAATSSSVTVLNFGKVLTTGKIAEVRNNPEVISAYLGVSS